MVPGLVVPPLTPSPTGPTSVRGGGLSLPLFLSARP